jgi:hypothetical protein
VAHAFFDTIVRLNEIPSSTVNDWDLMFTNQFWQELFSLAEIQLKLSSTFHPQIDNQSVATNKVITMYLRCLSDDCLRQWVQLLSWVDFWYNSAYQVSLHTSPFSVMYDHDLPPICAYSCSTKHLPSVHNQMLERDEFLAKIRDRLEKAQQHYKEFYDRKHREVEFEVGQWVWLRLLHRPVASLEVKGRGKLGPRLYGPFKIMGHWHGSLHVAATEGRQATRRLPRASHWR